MNEILASFWPLPYNLLYNLLQMFFFAFQLQTLLDLSLSLTSGTKTILNMFEHALQLVTTFGLETIACRHPLWILADTQGPNLTSSPYRSTPVHFSSMFLPIGDLCT